MRSQRGFISVVFVGMVAVACVAFAQAPHPASPAPAPAEPELFVPSLALIKEKEGKYTLVALTYMPNSCYRAILAKEGFPAKEKESDADGVQLIIKNEPGKLCAQMKWPVLHQLARCIVLVNGDKCDAAARHAAGAHPAGDVIGLAGLGG